VISDIFAVPIIDKYLIYAPLHSLATLVDRRGAISLRRAILEADYCPPATIEALLSTLRSPGSAAPQPRIGPINDPYFLGLIPTRLCNLSCLYCDFAGSRQPGSIMKLTTAQEAIEAYFQLARQSDLQEVEVHFFGGEPFFAENVVHFAVAYAESRAQELGLRVRFEATSNGVYNPERCRWIADYFDTIVLSLDGPEDIQEGQRPAKNGRKTAQTVIRNARILSEGPVELVIRSCVTQATVNRLPEIASWIASEFIPSTVCFEALTPSILSKKAGLYPPDPWDFARNFILASDILEEAGIETALSTVVLHNLRTSFCPVGQDALIISPDGSIDACYLMQDDWKRAGLDMHLGWLKDGKFQIDPKAVRRVRNNSVYDKPLCTACLCHYHCAGGCHINHSVAHSGGAYDSLCLQTRLITIASLLKRLGQDSLMHTWLDDRRALEISAWQSTDLLTSRGFFE